MVLPYLNGFDIIKRWFSILFHIYCVVTVFRYILYYFGILYSYLWFLTARHPNALARVCCIYVVGLFLVGLF
jgi:hypothetical protein